MFSNWRGGITVNDNFKFLLFHYLLLQISEEELHNFFSHAAERGIGGRLIPKYFTCVGKFKVRVEFYLDICKVNV